MGRKRKEIGKVFKRQDGTRVRYISSEAKWPPWTRPAPRGNTGKLYPFVLTLKELSPLVYAFVAQQLNKPAQARDPMIEPIVAEYRAESGNRRSRLSSKEFAAFVIERAMDGAWAVWKAKRPYSESDPDHFYRRYVLGNREALRDFRIIVAEPRPWPKHHRGHELKDFFGERGQAARAYKLLTTDSPLQHIRVISLFEEDAPPT